MDTYHHSALIVDWPNMTLASLSYEGQARKPSEKAARPADHLIVVHGLRESNHPFMLSTKSETFTVSCLICGKPVLLQECKIDDYRRPVHENWYVAVFLHETRTSGITPASTMPDEELPRLIADGNLQRCSACGYPFPADVRPSMSVAFAEHLMNGHKPEQTRKDESQAAARIIKK